MDFHAFYACLKYLTATKEKKNFKYSLLKTNQKMFCWMGRYICVSQFRKLWRGQFFLKEHCSILYRSQTWKWVQRKTKMRGPPNNFLKCNVFNVKIELNRKWSFLELHKHFCLMEVSTSTASTLHCFFSFWFVLLLLHVQLLAGAMWQNNWGNLFEFKERMLPLLLFGGGWFVWFGFYLFVCFSFFLLGAGCLHLHLPELA